MQTGALGRLFYHFLLSVIEQDLDDLGVAAASRQVNRRPPFLVLPFNSARYDFTAGASFDLHCVGAT